MAQLFVDSFSGYSSADLPTRYPGGNSSAGGLTISNAVLPPGAQAGAQALHNTGYVGGGGLLSTNYVAKARMVMGLRHFRATGAGGYVMQFCNAVGGGTNSLVAGLWLDATGSFIQGATNNIIASGPTIPNLEWHHFEMDVTFGTASNATLSVYLDGNPTPFMTATGVTLSAATAGFFALPTGIYNGTPAQVTPSTGYYADLYVFDGTGAAPFNHSLATQAIGAPKVAFTMPNGAGRISNWTANGAATIWQSINQIPQDGDTTFASSATVNNAFMVTLGTVPTMSALISVQVSNYAREDDAGPRSYQSGFGNGASETYSGVDQFLGGTYNYIEDEFQINPITGIAWVPGDLAALQVGLKLTN